MQITGGSFRGRKLTSPKGTETRPSPSRLREALFSIVGQNLEGKEFLDLFSGSGILSFEALSRGAETATLVEQDRKAVKCIQTNAKALGCEEQITLYPMDVQKALGRLSTFDVIYADPPYKKGWGPKLLQAIVELGLLKEGGIFFLEEGEDLEFDQPGLRLNKKRQYGSSYLYEFLSVAS